MFTWSLLEHVFCDWLIHERFNENNNAPRLIINRPIFYNLWMTWWHYCLQIKEGFQFISTDVTEMKFHCDGLFDSFHSNIFKII